MISLLVIALAVVGVATGVGAAVLLAYVAVREAKDGLVQRTHRAHDDVKETGLQAATYTHI